MMIVEVRFSMVRGEEVFDSSFSTIMHDHCQYLNLVLFLNVNYRIMCLNLKFIHKMSVKHNLLALMSLGIPMHIYAQETNIDTPNLSFENGNFENWKLSLGGIYAEVNGSDTTYHYDDWNVVNTTNQIRLVNGSVDSNDPTVSCWDFKTNPDGIMPPYRRLWNTSQFKR